MGIDFFKQNSYRIRIKVRSVLKTLFSGRNSENSSHTQMRTPVQIYAHPRTITHTRAHSPTPSPIHQTPMHTRTHPGTPAHTCAHPCTTVHTHTHLRTPGHTGAHPHTYPLMPADTLNLINQMNYM